MSHELKQQVMRRVYTTYWTRRFYTPLAIKTYALLGLIGVSALRVDFPHVFANMPRINHLIPDVYNVMGFSFNAFVETDLWVKFLSLAILATFVLMVRDIARNISGALVHVHRGA